MYQVGTNILQQIIRSFDTGRRNHMGLIYRCTLYQFYLFGYCMNMIPGNNIINQKFINNMIDGH